MKKLVNSAYLLITLGAVLFNQAAEAQVLQREPGRGDLTRSSVVHARKTLDGRTCSKGQVWQISGGSYKRGTDRTYRCVKDPTK